MKVYDTFFSELKNLGYKADLNEPPYRRILSRTYHTGTLSTDSCTYQAEFIRFDTGNLQVLSVYGADKADLDRFFTVLREQKGKHRFAILLRALVRYTYYMCVPCFVLLCLWCLYKRMWWKFFVIFFFMTLFRLVYQDARDVLGRS